MKLIYSELKKFIPDLSIEPQQLRDDLTLIGHFTNYFEKIDNEIIFDLDIKVNRGDCLGYYGLAKDLSVYYQLPLVLPENTVSYPSKYQLPITVTTDKVKRIMALKISDLKNSISPPWLQKFIKLHGTNPVNTLVDLTNYVMFLYGIPIHAFDTTKSTDNLIWEINSRFSEFTSLDGTKLPLMDNILMVNNPEKPLSLSFWGGEACAIDLATTDSIFEIAVYDRTIVRQNSRQLKTTTEAGIRLEKDLDPELIPLALNYLLKLVTENCGGQIVSQIFDYYPHPISPSPIKLNPQKVSAVAGINIPAEFSLDVLQRLGCILTDTSVVPPSLRPDLTLEADLIEEIIRFWGYQKIPTDQPLTFKSVTNITPPEIYLIDQLKDQLIALGYDEILSWPLTTVPLDSKTVVITQNSINSESIYLRQSILQSLKRQLDQYQRFKLPSPQFFEIGKIYSQKDGHYQEKYALGLYHFSSSQLQKDLFTLRLSAKIENNFAEIFLENLTPPATYLPLDSRSPAIELTSQIFTLDATITVQNGDPSRLLIYYSSIIDPHLLWSISIINIFQNRYTFRVSYYNCDDKTAKKTHLTAFGLN